LKHTYTHLQPEQLCRISALTDAGLSAALIAQQLGIHRCTLYREWRRCGGRAHYSAPGAQTDRRAARARGANNARRYDEAVWARVVHGLQAALSPDALVGRARLMESEAERALPCRSRIYAWAQQQGRAWWQQPALRLRRYGPRRPASAWGNNGAPAHSWRGRLSSIELRPEAVARRTEFGHFELDTVVGKQTDSARLLVAVDRASLKTKITLLPRCSAQAVADAIAHWRGRTKASRAQFRSFTPDQGAEFARLHTVFDPQHIYLCHKHSPWEKPVVENTNGLIRFYIPKGSKISRLTPAFVQWVEDQLNNRPRRVLGYRTPNEVASLPQPPCRAS
jgi:transposase, IS30 family